MNAEEQPPPLSLYTPPQGTPSPRDFVSSFSIVLNVLDPSCTGKLFRSLHLPKGTPATLEATTVLTTMLRQAMRADPKAALIADEPFPALRQHLPTVLARDEIVGHVLPSNTR